jgi:hypothetical protein
MLGKIGESVYHAGLQGNRILFALAELVIGWRLVVSAEVAQRKLAAVTPVTRVSDADQAFYRGKLAATRFYARNVLPGIAAARRLVEASDLDLMTLPDDCW